MDSLWCEQRLLDGLDLPSPKAQSGQGARARRCCAQRFGLSESTRRQLCHSVPLDIGIYHRRKPEIAGQAGWAAFGIRVHALMCCYAAVGPRDGSHKPKLHKPPVFLQGLHSAYFSLRRHASFDAKPQRPNRPVACRVLDSMTASLQYSRRLAHVKGTAEHSSVKQQFRSG